MCAIGESGDSSVCGAPVYGKEHPVVYAGMVNCFHSLQSYIYLPNL